MSGKYPGWQIDEGNRRQSILEALERYYRRFGRPPCILEAGAGFERTDLPDGLSLVVKSVRIPSNVILIGMDETEEKM